MEFRFDDCLGRFITFTSSETTMLYPLPFVCGRRPTETFILLATSGHLQTDWEYRQESSDTSQHSFFAFNNMKFAVPA